MTTAIANRLALALLLTALGCPSAEAEVAAPPEAAKLAPHRAVYDLELASTGSSSSVEAIQGRMVFEFTGNACEGYTQNVRFVMNVNNRDGGSTLSDLRSSTWENSGADQYKFRYDDFENQKATDKTVGDASRKAADGPIAVTLDKPQESKLAINPGTLFPVQHTIHLLAAALRGEHIMSADLYDGSDKGQKAFFTNTVIGELRPGEAGGGLEPIKNMEHLAGLKSWPVSIAFYVPGSTKAEGLPEHQMSFVLYENGVARKLALDYGSLTVKGTLAEIEFYEPAKCPN
jgi:EipB-like